jgi:hypothetical protein
MRLVSARRVRDLVLVTALGVGMVVVTAPAALATPPASHNPPGGGYPGETVTPKTNPAGQAKGDEPGRGAGGTEHDEGCPHDTDRALDDGHACGKTTAPDAVTPHASTPKVDRDGKPVAGSDAAPSSSTTGDAPATGASTAPAATATAPAVLGVSVVRALGDSLPATAGPAAVLGTQIRAASVSAAVPAAPASSSLAFTGLDAFAVGAGGLALLALGAALVAANRRRSQPDGTING